MSTELILTDDRGAGMTATLFTPNPKAARRVMEFFTAQINNDHTRRAYLNATRRFSQWCAGQGIEHLAAVQPIHVAACVWQLPNASVLGGFRRRLAGSLLDGQQK